jgi:hypothetical protein
MLIIACLCHSLHLEPNHKALRSTSSADQWQRQRQQRLHGRQRRQQGGQRRDGQSQKSHARVCRHGMQRRQERNRRISCKTRSRQRARRLSQGGSRAWWTSGGKHGTGRDAPDLALGPAASRRCWQTARSKSWLWLWHGRCEALDL